MYRLLEIQQKLKAPKDQYNSYGEYKYRSAEGILDAVKPLLNEQGLILTLTDEIVQFDTRFYVRACAALYDKEGKKIHEVFGMAREAESKKGMDEAQITGAASSYSRKYALNGLFAINDVLDPDATNTHGKETKQDAKHEKPICPKCGKETTQGALDNWGVCSSCKRENKKENKDA